MILNTNAASIHSNRGNGQLGLIFLTLSGAVYATLSSTPFVPPVNPGQNPDMTLGVTGPQIAEIRRKHKEALDEFTTYNNTDKALTMHAHCTHTPLTMHSLTMRSHNTHKALT